MKDDRSLVRWHWLLISALMTSLLASPAVALDLPSKLLSTEWLEDHLGDENLRIIDVREDVRDYWQGHIPGAVCFSPEAMRLADGGVPGKLLPPRLLAIMLGVMGVDEHTAVVIYAEQSDYKAPYLIWALDYIGHSSSGVLEGGFERWSLEARSVTQDYPEITAKEYTMPHQLHQEVRATTAEVEGALLAAGTVLLDVRPLELYTGERGPWKRKGHIPGAKHHFWGDDLREDGTWKDASDLRRIYQSLGATPEKTIIVSCGQGLMAAHAYFTLKHILGFPNVKNYDGSFNEWSNIDRLPVATGTE